MTTEDVTTQDDNQPEPTPPESDSVNGDATQQPEPDSRVLFSQDEVNRINAETKRRAKKQAEADFLAKFGVSSPDDLAAIVKAQKAAEDAQKSELEKAIAAQAKAEKKAEVALQAANDKLIRAAFLAEAGKVQAQYPKDAFLLADKSEIKLTDEGEVEGVEAAVKVLVDSGRLSTTGKPKAPNLDNGAGTGKRSTEKSGVDKLTQAEIAQANKMGVSLEDYAKNK